MSMNIGKIHMLKGFSKLSTGSYQQSVDKINWISLIFFLKCNCLWITFLLIYTHILFQEYIFVVKNSTKWKKVLEQIKNTSTEMSYNTWFKNLKLASVDEESGTAVVIAADPLAKKIISDRYYQMLAGNFEDVFGQKYDIYVRLEDEAEEPLAKKRTFREYDAEYLFHPKWTFDTFVVGEHNSLAHAAAVAVAEAPSEVFNPLFIYGGSGLGKTHLMHAIAIYLSEHSPELNVLYVSSEMFTNELIKALGENKQREFKNKYRKVDVLLIDDIQFLENKETTQEEFFHTFNDLYDLNKQIVITSDRPPNELTTLEERLRSRFSWNMIAGLSPSDYETRVAILVKKSQNFRMEMDDDLYEVICLIAEKITDNIRELEGALNRINSFSKLLHEHIDVAFAKGILTEILKNNKTTVTPDKIKTTVCHKFNLKISEIDSSKRTNKVAYPRQIAMYLCRDLTDYSYTQIGNYFGGRHYTTVMHACDVIQKEIGKDEEKRNLISQLKEEIKA